MVFVRHKDKTSNLPADFFPDPKCICKLHKGLPGEILCRKTVFIPILFIQDN
jgi:hypothetical protein